MHIVSVKSSNMLTLDRNRTCNAGNNDCKWENIYFLYMLPVQSVHSLYSLLLLDVECTFLFQPLYRQVDQGSIHNNHKNSEIKPRRNRIIHLLPNAD